MRPFEVTIAFADAADRQREVRLWLDALTAQEGVAHATLRTLNDLGALVVLFVDDRTNTEPTLDAALRSLRRVAPDCAVAVRGTNTPNAKERTSP